MKWANNTANQVTYNFDFISFSRFCILQTNKTLRRVMVSEVLENSRPWNAFVLCLFSLVVCTPKLIETREYSNIIFYYYRSYLRST